MVKHKNKLTDAQKMIAEHARGEALRPIGIRHGVSHETARKQIREESRRMIDELERDLIVARTVEHRGQIGEWPSLVVPYQAQADWQLALALLQFSVDQVRARGLHVHIHTAHHHNGVIFQLRI